MSTVPVMIVGIQLDPSSGSAVVLAENQSAHRVLPIIIGPAEAQAIVLGLAGAELPRPGTHDLMMSVLDEVDCRLEEVAVTELVDGTFHAELFLEASDGLHRVSARPSDALALAVRCSAPIHVSADVLELAGVEIERDDDAEPLSDEEIDRAVAEFRELLATADPGDITAPPESEAEDPPTDA